MATSRKSVNKMAEWTREEYAAYSPAARGRKIRETIGDSRSARSFVRRHMPEFYADAYGSTSSASSGLVSASNGRLHAKPR